jgi:aldehyde:ferredoxin oxidoreductase
MGKMLEVDLDTGKTGFVSPSPGELRQYVGGTGLGIKYLYERVAPGVEWDHPDNVVIIATGPFSGTTMGGSGLVSIVTKGCLTNGATSTQANGFAGAFMKLSGLDGIIIRGAALRLSYLYVHDGNAELRDADHLSGKDTWETEAAVKKELGGNERQLSVFSIGPAGENLVKFAALVGDKGHVASHNGVGAVLGSKRLKAVVVSRGKESVPIHNRKQFSSLTKDLFERAKANKGLPVYEWGTMGDNAAAENRLSRAVLPIRNYTTNYFPQGARHSGEMLRSRVEAKWSPCWACKFRHLHQMKLTQGPYEGYSGEEPEYEQIAAFGSLIGQGDLEAAFVLSNDVDRMGMDANETGWVIAWVIECFEKGILGTEDTGGLEMTWGNVEAVRAMLQKITRREGIGDILAEGAMRASQKLRPEGRPLAVFTRKGNTPRMHDHRAYWPMMLDTCTSDTGTDSDAGMRVGAKEVGLPEDTDPFSPHGAGALVAAARGNGIVDDLLGVCKFNLRGYSQAEMAGLLNAATGWDVTGEEFRDIGRRIATLLKVFNFRHGLRPETDAPSDRYGSAPLDGPFHGMAAAPAWEEMLAAYYDGMGWDQETGKPLPQTLSGLGLEHVIEDIR